MSIQKLTAENAIIKTASVEVKTLTISGKQVTLAVFRQLPEKELISASLELNGIPWGRVNYCPTKPCLFDHHHIVWQEGETLYRDKVLNRFSIIGCLRRMDRVDGFDHPYSSVMSEFDNWQSWAADLKKDHDRIEEYNREKAQYDAFIGRYDALYQQLSELPQLYIAV